MKLQELFEEEEERSVLSVFGQSPEHKNGNFYCSNSKLTSLDGSPKSVSGDFNCAINKLKSLKYSPIRVEGNFDCGGNQIDNFDFAPAYIGLDADFSKNNIKSLHNIHKHIKHIGGNLYLGDNPLESHVLGLLLIDGLKRVWISFKYQDLQKIINKHLFGDRDVFACQEELIEAGYDEFAQL